MDRKTISAACRAFTFLFVFYCTVGCALLTRSLWAGHNNITHMDVVNIIHAQTIAPNGVYVQLLPFRALEKTQSQTIQIQCSGTSPNYKAELLVTLDRAVFTAPPSTITFTKPEIGGDLYTFTDALVHVFPLFSPACLGNELRITELGGANSLTIVDAWELSQ